MADEATERQQKAEALGAFLNQFVQQVMIIPLDVLDDFIQEGERYDTIGPIMDPTEWRSTHKHVRVAVRTAQAFRRFRSDLEKLKDDVEQNR